MKRLKSKTKEPERAHKKCSPSTSERWMKCPGSVAAIEAIAPEDRRKTSKYALMGTAAHSLLERCLRDGVDADEYSGRVLRVLTDKGGNSTVHLAAEECKHYGDGEESSFLVNADMVEAVQVCIDHVRKEMKRLGPNAEMVLEAKCRPFEDTEEGSGTGDIILTNWPWEVVVIDYKHGAGVLVEIGGNTQLRCYMAGAVRADDFNFDRGKITIVQPRYGHPDGACRSEKVSMEKLRRFTGEIRRAIARTEEPDAERVAGDHCMWCDAAPWCREFKAWEKSEGARDFESVEDWE